MVHQTSFDSFVLFGDSITQYSFNVTEKGFGAQLAHLFQRRLDVINRGFSGYTTAQGIHLLPQFFASSLCHDGQEQAAAGPIRLAKIQFLTIFMGANDACLPGSVQHVDLDQYESNLRSLIDSVHDPTSPTYSPETKIILICPPMIDEPRWAMRRAGQGIPMDRATGVSQQYSETCARLGREYEAKNEAHRAMSNQKEGVHWRQVDVIPTWELMNTEVQNGHQTLNHYLLDGLHLAAKGNILIFDQIMGIIRRKYPEWDPEVMPMHAPWWGELDRANPEQDLLICDNKVKPSV